MSYDPLSEVVDAPLSVSAETLRQLKALLSSDKFTELPGTNTAEEKTRLSELFNTLLERLANGVTSNPRKRWVMAQFQLALDAISTEDTEARELFGAYLERVMDIFSIESSDGLLGFYL